jgi:hypothetical protein
MPSKQRVDQSPSQDVRAFLSNEREKFSRVVRTLGITMGP